MEPVSIAILGTVIFGAVTALSVFIRQLLLSRDKSLNDKAQQRALAQESQELERLRLQMENRNRFDSHYQALGVHKDAIRYLDLKIDEILHKKMELIQRYSKTILSDSIVHESVEQRARRKVTHDLLRHEMNQEIAFYNRELHQFQMKRSALWDTHFGLQDYLLDQEKARNERLDNIYLNHTALLEKLFLRHNLNAEHVAVNAIDAGSQAFGFITEPLKLLLRFFGITSNINAQQVFAERDARANVWEAERQINSDDEEEYVEEDQETWAASDLIT